ncbi:MAG: ATP-binding protein [Oscillospiraceae bacterium]|nr:ATP-binding protein [Oscillospiraceae bacterium]
MRIIPKNTRVKIEFFKGVDLPDAIIGVTGVALEVILFSSNIPGKYWIMLGILLFFTLLMLRIDGDKVYMMFLQLLRHFALPRKFGGTIKKRETKGIAPFTGIKDGFIEYGGEYYAKVLEVPSVEFRFYSEMRQNNMIDRVLGAALRQSGDMMVNLIKLDRPINFDKNIDAEHEKIEEIKKSYSNGLLSKEELDCREEVLNDRIGHLRWLNDENRVMTPCYYLAFFDRDKQGLNEQAESVSNLLSANELNARILGDSELAAFCRYNYGYDFDEREAEEIISEEIMDWITPENISLLMRRQIIGGLNTSVLRVTNYPTSVYNAWGHRIFDIPDTKVVMKMSPMDKYKSVRRIDRAIDELRGQQETTGKTSRLIELEEHIETLTNLLLLLQNDSETMFEVNLYITVYDRTPGERVSAKRRVRRILSEEGFRTEDMMLKQFDAFVGSGVSAFDPMRRDSRGIHSTSAAAVFPFIHCNTRDPKGILLGDNGSSPVLIDFFKRDNNHVNSNMVIIGKSGSGKSFATKTILANLAAEDSKVFILDPENEYSQIAKKMGGKVIDVGNAKTGRLNPFHIVPSVDEEESIGNIDGEEEISASEPSNYTSYTAHLQFLEEFFSQIIPDINSDAMEMLNTNIMLAYSNRGINGMTDLTALSPSDFPTFDDLYDALLSSFQSVTSEFGKNNLRILLTHVSKFAGEGRNARLWNGEATIATKENFVVFNFQSLLANRNNTVANAQMLLVLKWLDNEIIKNRDYNLKYNAQRKIIVVVDEAHVFIDTKFPVALDFMFQMAKRIRKYNGMQIVITQNIKDFVGSEEIARKSTAIINASQYSFIFALAPNDMHDLCKLYEKAGAINESEQEEIINNARGQAFVVTSPTNRTRVRIVASEELQKLY